MKPPAIEVDYSYSRSGIYKVLKESSHEEYMNYIDGLPLNTAPEVFGLHDNAEIANN